MRRMKRFFAGLLAIIMILGLSPANFNNSAYATTIPAPFAGAGASISNLYFTNDGSNLYIYLPAVLANWGNDDGGMYVDIALDVSGVSNNITANPWGRQYDYSGTSENERPDWHVICQLKGSNTIQWIDVRKSGQDPVISGATNDNFAISTSGFEAKIPLSTLELADDSVIRAIAVISGNVSNEHGAFAVWPMTADNQTATEWVTSSPNVLSSYTASYTVDTSKTDSRTIDALDTANEWTSSTPIVPTETVTVTPTLPTVTDTVTTTETQTTPTVLQDNADADTKFYVVASDFESLVGGSDWDNAGAAATMIRKDNYNHEWSCTLPAGAYQYKVVEKGTWNEVTGTLQGENNFSFTLTSQTNVTFYFNSKTKKLAINVPNSNPAVIQYLDSYKKDIRLIGSVLGSMGVSAGDQTDPAKTEIRFSDENMDGKVYSFTKKIAVGSYTAKAVLNKSLSSGVYGNNGQDVALNLPREVEVTFKVDFTDSATPNMTATYETVEPILSVQAPTRLAVGRVNKMKATFTDEFKTASNQTVVWSLKTPVTGVSINSATGDLTVGSSVPLTTKVTIVATVNYNSSAIPAYNKAYTKEIEMEVAENATDFVFNYRRYDGNYTDWGIWAWGDNIDGFSTEFGPAGVDGWATAIVTVPGDVEDISFIPKKGNWLAQEGSNRYVDGSIGKEVWIVSEENADVFYSKEEAEKSRVRVAYMDSTTEVTFFINGTGQNVDYSRFGLYMNGVKIGQGTSGGATKKGKIVLNSPITDPSAPYMVRDSLDEYSPRTVIMRNVLNQFAYTGDDLGYTKNGATSTFKVWAPTAKKVSLALYSSEGTYDSNGNVTGNNAPTSLYNMTKDNASGVWTISMNTPANKYYTYKVEFVDGTINYAVDPYAKAVTANGGRTYMVDLAASNPTKWTPSVKPQTVLNPNDHIIYELHVRDFSIDPNASFNYKGKFLAFTETGLKDSSGNSIGIDHLKKLGITTVQLLPSYDFRTVNEKTIDNASSTDAKFNWGYDPQNYNVPEGSYSTNPSNPTTRITEFKQMVQALHDADIRVVMDVVYNHTASIEDGPFNKIVPGYFYRTDDTLNYTNGSGCGNEVASERTMVRKYIIDSVKYWATEYNVDGFRFDLFGLIDAETMSQLANELQNNVDNTIVLYGEPWTGGATPLTNGIAKGTQKNNGYGVFNDDFRGAIKGGSDDASKGFATGQIGQESGIVKGIYGSTELIAAKPSETINYVTAHDNLNLWDKILTTQGLTESLKMLSGKILNGSMIDGSSVDAAVAKATPYANVDFSNELLNETVRRSILTTGIILTSQGVPFFQAGDEFARTKYGDHNSYKSPDSVNMIRWDNVAKFDKLNDYYAGLIQLRREHPAFRINDNTKLGDITILSQTNNIVAQVIKNYANGDTWQNIVVIYNANSSNSSFTIPAEYGSQWKVVVDDTAAGVTTLKTVGNTFTVNGLSMMVLYSGERAASNVATTIEIDSTISIEKGKELRPNIVVKDANGAIMLDAEVQVAVANTAIVQYTDGKFVAKADGTTTATITSGAATKQVTISVGGISAAIAPISISSRENAVITVNTVGINVQSISADLTQLGGSNNYPISTVSNKATIAVKDSIGAGVKTVPVKITAVGGKVYNVTATVTVKAVDISKGFDWDEAIIYFMVTDRFYDGSTANNTGTAFNKADPGMFHGGDFAGVTAKLDYLKDLGINTIWITPIVEQNYEDWCDTEKTLYAYHGYWANDFTKLSPYLGTQAELDTLIDEAHNRDMKIMVDVVLNHPGYGTVSNFEGMLRTAFDSSDEKMSLSYLPDFLTENQEVREQLIEWQTAWAAHTTSKGNRIDYYRVDTVKHVDHETWKQFKNALTAVNPTFKMIGEAWDDSADGNKLKSYLNNGEMDSVLDFNFNNIVKNFVDGNIDSAEAAFESRNTFLSNVGTMGNFLSSHDEEGFLYHHLNGNKTKMMIAAALQITAKGQTVIYYGEELGQSGANNWPDYGNRYDIDWTKANDDNAMYVHYKKLLNIRQKYSRIFAKGTRTKLVGSNALGYMVFSREYDGQSVIIGINNSASEKQVTLTTAFNAGDKIYDEYSGQNYTVAENKTITVKLPPAASGGTAILWNTSVVYPPEQDDPIIPVDPDDPVIPPLPPLPEPDVPTPPTPSVLSQMVADLAGSMTNANVVSSGDSEITITVLNGAKECSIPADKLKELSQKNIKLKVQVMNANISIPLDAIDYSSIADTASIKISVEVKNAVEIEASTGAKTISNVYEVTFEANGTKITNFLNPIEVELLIEKSKLNTVTDINKITVYYVENGVLKENMKGFVDMKQHNDSSATMDRIIFKTSHLSRFVIVESTKTFDDITNSWAKYYIEVVAAKGITLGVTETQFAPRGTITRGQFATMIARTFGMATGAYKNSFSDVSENMYYAASVEALSDLGIMIGSDGKFRPNDYINREEMAIVLIRLYSYLQMSSTEDSSIPDFADAGQISNWAKAYVDKARVLKLVSGVGNNTYAPKNYLDRASAAKILYDLLVRASKLK